MQVLPSSLEPVPETGSGRGTWSLGLRSGHHAKSVDPHKATRVQTGTDGHGISGQQDVRMSSGRWNRQARASSHFYVSPFDSLFSLQLKLPPQRVGGANFQIHFVQHRWSLEEVAMRINLPFGPRVSHNCSSSSIEGQKDVRNQDHFFRISRMFTTFLWITYIIIYICYITYCYIIYIIYKWSSNHKSQRATRSPWGSSWLPMTSVASKERSLSQDKTDDITVIIVT
jgi:hypothetical protein